MLWMFQTSKNIRKISKNIQKDLNQKLSKKHPKNIRKTSKKHLKNHPRTSEKHRKKIRKRSKKELWDVFWDDCIPFHILFDTYAPSYIIIIYFVILCELEIFQRGDIAHNNDITLIVNEVMLRTSFLLSFLSFICTQVGSASCELWFTQNLIISSVYF